VTQVLHAVKLVPLPPLYHGETATRNPKGRSDVESVRGGLPGTCV